MAPVPIVFGPNSRCFSAQNHLRPKDQKDRLLTVKLSGLWDLQRRAFSNLHVLPPSGMWQMAPSLWNALLQETLLEYVLENLQEAPAQWCFGDLRFLYGLNKEIGSVNWPSQYSKQDTNIQYQQKNISEKDDKKNPKPMMFFFASDPKIRVSVRRINLLYSEPVNYCCLSMFLLF